MNYQERIKQLVDCVKNDSNKDQIDDAIWDAALDFTLSYSNIHFVLQNTKNINAYGLLGIELDQSHGGMRLLGSIAYYALYLDLNEELNK